MVFASECLTVPLSKNIALGVYNLMTHFGAGFRGSSLPTAYGSTAVGGIEPLAGSLERAALKCNLVHCGIFFFSLASVSNLQSGG